MYRLACKAEYRQLNRSNSKLTHSKLLRKRKANHLYNSQRWQVASGRDGGGYWLLGLDRQLAGVGAALAGCLVISKPWGGQAEDDNAPWWVQNAMLHLTLSLLHSRFSGVRYFDLSVGSTIAVLKGLRQVYG